MSHFVLQCSQCGINIKHGKTAVHVGPHDHRCTKCVPLPNSVGRAGTSTFVFPPSHELRHRPQVVMFRGSS